MSIQAVSFGKTNQKKNGNSYEKAKAGGYAGLVAGAAMSAINGTKAVKVVKKAMNATTIKNLYKENLSKLPKDFGFKDFAKYTIRGSKIGTAVTIGIAAIITTAMAFGLGKIIDAVTNNIRAKKADAAATNAEPAKQPEKE